MLYEKCWWEAECMHHMMFVHNVENGCEENDKYYLLSVPRIKKKISDLHVGKG